jgi:hypothetical protein
LSSQLLELNGALNNQAPGDSDEIFFRQYPAFEACRVQEVGIILDRLRFLPGWLIISHESVE